MTSGYYDLAITAFLEEHPVFFLEEEDIPMKSKQVDLNIERASQKHVNSDIKKLMVNVSNPPYGLGNSPCSGPDE